MVPVDAVLLGRGHAGAGGDPGRHAAGAPGGPAPPAARRPSTEILGRDPVDSAVPVRRHAVRHPAAPHPRSRREVHAVDLRSRAAGRRRPSRGSQMMDEYSATTKAIADAGVHVCGDALQGVETATTVQVTAGGERMVTDGPFAETREVLGGYYLLDVPDLDAAIDWAARCPGRPARLPDRGPADHGVRPAVTERAGSRRRRGGVPRGARPAARRPRPPVRRPRPRRGGRRRRRRGGAAAVAGRRRARAAGGLAAHHRPPPGHRRAAPQPQLRHPAGAAAGRGGARRRRPPSSRARRRRRARRAAAAVLHLLPPGARAGRADRADPALPGRAGHARGGAGLPAAHGHRGAAHRPGQAQDPRRAHPVPGAGRRRAARPAARRAAGALPDLHRGLRGQRRRRS